MFKRLYRCNERMNFYYVSYCIIPSIMRIVDGNKQKVQIFGDFSQRLKIWV